MLPIRSVVKTWWPLAASWLLMGIELPALSAVVLRLPDPEVNLAAYNGIVFSLALIIESPIIMLLAASTALSKDWDSYRKLYRFMMVASGALTGLHILIAFTPLYSFVAFTLLDANPEAAELGRIGLMIMTPWTWSIAYRRFNQGVLIRFDHARAVGAGTVVRLIADLLVLAIGYWIGSIPGIVVATIAVAAGVISEAVFSGIIVRPVIQRELKIAPPVKEPVTLRSFLVFYIPLAMTSLITLITNPLGSAALWRMPEAIPSQAVWPVVSGLVFMLRSLGMAYNEVVVALLDQPQAVPSLRRFTVILASSVTAVLLFLAATPLAGIWFEEVSNLSPHLADLARNAIWLALPLPGLTVLQSWFQGIMVNDRRTRGITEAVLFFLIVTAIFLGAGVVLQNYTGIYVGLVALGAGSIAQTVWLWWRSRRSMGRVIERDQAIVT